MSIQAGGFLHTQLATTVAYLLKSTTDQAQRLIENFRDLEDLDAETLSVVSDLIVTSLHHSPDSDEISQRVPAM